MRFFKSWMYVPTPEGADIGVPILDVLLKSRTGRRVRETFVVDSGADISLAPRTLCEKLGITWRKGSRKELSGISSKKECVVAARVHDVEIYPREANCRIVIPLCFAEGEAPLLLGREGFFDAFRIEFDKARALTSFELIEH